MKLIFCVIFPVLFLNFCENSRAVDPIAEAGKVFAKWESNGHAKLKFSDLPEDCLIIILEMSSFEILMNVAELGQNHLLIANLAFRRRYANHQITSDFILPEAPEVEEPSLISNALQWFGFQIEQKITKPKPKARARPNIVEEDSEVVIKDFELIERTFKYFGRVISKLKVIYNYNRRSEAKFIGKLISDYCSKTLVDVEFVDCAENNLEHITKPLTNVRIVTFGGKLIISGYRSLSVLFPAVERLQLDCWFIIVEGIDVHLPHLKHFSIRIGSNKWYYSLRHLSYVRIFEKWLAKNAHIRSFKLHMHREVSSELIHSVNRLLPNLENLCLSQFHDIDDEIRFENVTTFSVKSYRSSPHNICVPKLKTLYVQFEIDKYEAWKRFLMQHNQLTTLHMEFVETVQGNQMISQIHIDQFTSDLTNLSEINWWLHSYRTVSASDVRNLLRNHEKLTRFNFVYQDVEPYLDQLRHTLIRLRIDLEAIVEVETDWIIVDLPKGIALQRTETEQ